METKMFYAVDVVTLEEAVAQLSKIELFADVIKVGLQFFESSGNEKAALLGKIFQKPVFFDKKFCDTPHTVQVAMMEVVRYGPAYVTVLASGGREMMEAAMEGAVNGARKYGCDRPKIIAVTVPTSQTWKGLWDDGIRTAAFAYQPQTPEEQQSFVAQAVMRRAKCAMDAGLDGMVCSPWEGREVMRRWPHAEVLTPGIRYVDAERHDQRRVMSPHDACAHGLRNLIVGRAISCPPEGVTLREMAGRVHGDMQRGACAYVEEHKEALHLLP